MKQTFGILTFIFMILACPERNDKVEKFKKYIGTENFEATDQFLSNMEDRLRATYQTGTLKGDIKQYLEEKVKGNSTIKFTQEDCDALVIYELSGMETKFTKGKYDTVFIDGDDLIMQYGNNWSEEILIMEGKSKEEIIKEKEDKGYWKLIHWGILLGGLEHIAGQDTMITRYIDFKKKVGDISPKIPAGFMLESGIDFSKSYFHRLIILVEFYYRELKEYGC